MDECKPLPTAPSHSISTLSWLPTYRQVAPFSRSAPRAASQGRTLVHFLAQLKRILWDWGSFIVLFKGCLGGARGYNGVSGGVKGVFCVRNGSG